MCPVLLLGLQCVCLSTRSTLPPSLPSILGHWTKSIENIARGGALLMLIQLIVKGSLCFICVSVCADSFVGSCVPSTRKLHDECGHVFDERMKGKERAAP